MNHRRARGLLGRLDWRGAPLRRQVEADIRDAGFRKGSLLPESAPRIEIARRKIGELVQLPTGRRRIVETKKTGSD